MTLVFFIGIHSVQTPSPGALFLVILNWRQISIFEPKRNTVESTGKNVRETNEVGWWMRVAHTVVKTPSIDNRRERSDPPSLRCGKVRWICCGTTRFSFLWRRNVSSEAPISGLNFLCQNWASAAVVWDGLARSVP